MVEVGTRVQFVPHFMGMVVSGFARDPTPVVGEVIFANPEKEFFVAEFPVGCGVLREGFQYWDIGRLCTVLLDENRGDPHG